MPDVKTIKNRLLSSVPLKVKILLFAIVGAGMLLYILLVNHHNRIVNVAAEIDGAVFILYLFSFIFKKREQHQWTLHEESLNRELKFHIEFVYKLLDVITSLQRYNVEAEERKTGADGMRLFVMLNIESYIKKSDETKLVFYKESIQKLAASYGKILEKYPALTEDEQFYYIKYCYSEILDDLNFYYDEYLRMRLNENLIRYTLQIIEHYDTLRKKRKLW